MSLPPGPWKFDGGEFIADDDTPELAASLIEMLGEFYDANGAQVNVKTEPARSLVLLIPDLIGTLTAVSGWMDLMARSGVPAVFDTRCAHCCSDRSLPHDNLEPGFACPVHRVRALMAKLVTLRLKEVGG